MVTTRRKITAAAGLASAAALASLLLQAPQGDPRTDPLVQPAGSLTYLGSFKVPDTDGIDWHEPHQFTWTSIGVAGSAGPGRLFFGCHAQSPATLGIVEIPPIGGVAKVITGCTPMPNPGALGDDPSGRYVGGAMVHNGRTVVDGYIYYDGAGGQRKTHWFGPSLGAMQGPALVQAQNVRLPLPSGGTAYPPAGMIAGWMGPIPGPWQPLLGGPAFTGQGAIAITSRSSYGPAFSVFDPAALGTADPVPATMLIGYPDAHRTLGEWGPSGGAWRGPKITPYYSGADSLAGMFWVPGTRSVVSIGRHGTGLPEMLGDNCYGPGTNDPAKIGTLDAAGNHFCFDPSNGNKGPHSYRYQDQAMAFDALDLLEVKAGTKKPWDVKPHAVWKFGAGTPLDKPGINITGMAFDPSTNRLYLSTGWTTVEVFQVAAGVPTPPDPVEVCGDGIDNDGDGAVDEGCPAEVCGDGIDNDGDGAVDENCPAEVCGDGIDNDGDGRVDEDCPTSTTVSCEVRGNQAPYADRDAKVTARCETNGKTPIPVGAKFTITLAPKG